MRGIEFEVVWFDKDVIEYQITCSNGSFCGTTKMYLGYDDLSKAADELNGFPANVKDLRHVQFGSFDPKIAGGGIDMNFYCVDSAGHAVVLARIWSDRCKGMGEAESAALYIPVEPGAIDSFVGQARSIRDTKGAKAYLHMADHTLGWVRRFSPLQSDL